MLNALNDICRIVERRNKIPILNDVIIKPLGHGFVTLQATDLEILLSIKCEIDSHSGLPENGVCVGAYTLREAVKALGDASFKYENDVFSAFTDKQSIIIKNVLPGDEFPAMPIRDKKWSQLCCPIGSKLSDAFAYCKTAMSNEETRYYLCGVCLQLKGSDWTIVATDGHRLRCVKSNSDLPHGEHDQSLIIPRKTVNSLLAIKRNVLAVFVSPDERCISFTFDDGSILTSNLIDGSFPAWNRVVPNGDGEFLTFTNKKDALKTIKDMVRFIGKNSSVKIEPGIRLTTYNDENEMTSQFEGEYDGETFGVKGCYLAQELADCDNELKLIVKDANSPIVTIHNGDLKRFGILMPLRVK